MPLAFCTKNKEEEVGMHAGRDAGLCRTMQVHVSCVRVRVCVRVPACVHARVCGCVRMCGVRACTWVSGAAADIRTYMRVV